MSGALTGAALCLFSHPDDEFAIFGEIDRLVREGRRVVCIYLTDGAYGGQSAQRRAAESQAALQHLGIRAEDVHFPGWDLGIGDTKLYLHLADALDATRRLIGGSAGLRLLVPAWEGGHHDHDATHLIGLSLARELRDADVWQFSIYHGRGLPSVFFRVMSPIPENGPVTAQPVPWNDRLRHLGLFLLYPSQWKTWIGLLPLVAANYLLVGAQRLQRVSVARVNEPPHRGPLLYERRGFCTWTAFDEHTRQLRTSLGRTSAT